MRTSRVVPGLLLAMLPVAGWAQSGWREPGELPPHLAVERGRAKGGAALDDPELDRLAATLSERVRRQFQQSADEAEGPAPSCASPEAVARRLRALRTLGRFDACVELADRCQAGTAPGQDAVLAEGGRCADAAHRFTRALELFDAASAPAFDASPIHEGVVLLHARFAHFTHYEDRVPAILARHPVLAARSPLVVAALELLRDGSTSRAPRADAEAEAARWMASPDPVLRQAGRVGWAAHLAFDLYEVSSALRLLDGWDDLASPEEWLPTAYFGLFHQPLPGALLHARMVYDAARPHLHGAGWLPTAENTETYTGIEEAACSGKVLGGTGAAGLRATGDAWLAGTASTESAAATVGDVARTFPGADVLTFQGNLLEAQGNGPAAVSRYWAAHRACPFYDRAHVALAEAAARARRNSFADAPALAERARRAASAAPFPPELSSYVVNWSWLGAEGRAMLQESLAFWAPHVKRLHDRGQRIYVKPSFRLMSEVPGLEFLRDQRIDFGGAYRDNRLWDDVSGASTGELSVFPYAALEAGRWFTYNVAAHEVAHGFHSSLAGPQAQCITRLYAGASRRGAFPDPYAALNSSEYFAQAVGYFIRPVDAPSRLGVNRQWLIENDPELERFLRDIESGMDPAAIGCPAG
jgi:hypothetical protein